MKPTRLRSVPLVRAVERAVDILTALAENDLRLVDVAERVKLHKATANRLLASLAHSGMVLRSDDDLYQLGPAVFALASRPLSRYRTLAEFLHGALTRVQRATGETVSLHVRSGVTRVCVDEMESSHDISYRAGVGKRVPLHVGASGRVLLAFLDTVQQARIVSQLRMAPLTDRTITGGAALRTELVKTRRLGHAISTGERIPGGAAVSVPVMDTAGNVLAAMTVRGPEARLTPAALTRCARILKREIPRIPAGTFTAHSRPR